MAPFVALGDATLQLSLAVAVPSASSIVAELGLHPRVNVLPLAVITGAIKSSFHVTVRLTGVAELPHASDTFHVLVCERKHGSPVTAADEGIGGPTLQLSEAVAVPSAASIAADDGLQPMNAELFVGVITGAIKSSFHVTVTLTGVAVLPHASDTFHVLVCERKHGFPVTAVIEGVGDPTLQLSEAVAVPS